MADNLSPLVNLDLVNQIYRTINAQISERVYDPNYYSAAELGDANHRYVNAYLKALNVSGDVTITGDITGVKSISATTFNDLTLKSESKGFKISGGTASKDLIVADTTSIDKPLTISANTTISANLTVSAATKIIKELTVGADNTGTVTIKSGGTGNTTIVGPNSEIANLIKGTYTDSATTKNSTNPTNGYLLKIGEVGAGKFLAGPASGSGTADYRKIVASDLPEAGASASGIVTTDTQTFAGEKTFSETIKGSINGNAATTDQVKTIKTDSNASYHVSFVGGNNASATKETVYTNSKLTYNPSTGTLSATTFSGNASKLAHSLSVKDGASTPAAAVDGWNGSADKTLTIKGGTNSPITTAATDGTITITHDKKGPDTTKATSAGDTTSQTPGFGGTFKVTSATVDAYGHTTALAEHNVTIPSTTASEKASGLVTTEDQTFAGVKTFSNETDSNADRTKGAVIVKGGLSVVKDIYANAVHNAVWNDLVDCMEVPEDTSLEYGYCYSWKGDSVVKSSRSIRNCIGIHSNTAGFAMGEKKTKTIRAAVAGFVLAYVDEIYPEGTPLTWGDDGILTKCSLLKRVLHPERVIATFYKEEKEEKWHSLPVSGRHWVKVR